MPSDPLLEFREVSFEVGGQKIIDRVNWIMRADEHWALLGPNGSGKTTLLRLATGFLWPNAGGSIWRCGQQCLNLGSLRQSIGWVAAHLVAAVSIAGTRNRDCSQWPLCAVGTATMESTTAYT